MRWAPRLIVFSLLLAGCSAQQEQTIQPPEAEPEIQTQPSLMSLEQVIDEYSELIDCSSQELVFEGEFETVVCNQGIIRFWHRELTDTEYLPWTVWCEPTMAAGLEPSYELIHKENFIIHNQNQDSLGVSGADNLCLQLENRELTALGQFSDDAYGNLTNLAISGLCMEPPAITATSPVRHVCSGFGLEEQSFTLWLETGEIGQLIDEYSAECGSGIVGTYGGDWLKTSYDTEVIIRGERLASLLSLVSPLPFSHLCKREEAG